MARYVSELRRLLLGCEYGDLGQGCEADEIKALELQFRIHLPSQFQDFLREVGWFYGYLKGVKIGIFGDGEGVDPHLWVGFNNSGRFKGTEWFLFAECNLDSHAIAADMLAPYDEWFAFSRATEGSLQPYVYRYRMYPNFSLVPAGNKAPPDRQWVYASDNFDTWLASMIVLATRVE